VVVSLVVPHPEVWSVLAVPLVQQVSVALSPTPLATLALLANQEPSVVLVVLVSLAPTLQAWLVVVVPPMALSRLAQAILVSSSSTTSPDTSPCSTSSKSE
jgi:hypothetical protein